MLSWDRVTGPACLLSDDWKMQFAFHDNVMLPQRAQSDQGLLFLELKTAKTATTTETVKMRGVTQAKAAEDVSTAAKIFAISLSDI